MLKIIFGVRALVFVYISKHAEQSRRNEEEQKSHFCQKQ